MAPMLTHVCRRCDTKQRKALNRAESERTGLPDGWAIIHINTENAQPETLCADCYKRAIKK